MNHAHHRAFVKARDIQHLGDLELRIDRVHDQEFVDHEGEVQKRLVVDFAGPWSLVVNKTNHQRLQQLLGEQSNWPGQEITLVLEETKFKGQPVPGVRVFMPALTPTRKETA